MWCALCVLVMGAWGASWTRAQNPDEGGGFSVVALKCPPEALEAGRCKVNNISSGQYTATINGNKLYIKLLVGTLYEMKCQDEVALDDEALPRFSSPQRVVTVRLLDCAAPRNGSYATALATIGLVKPERSSDYEEAVVGYNNLTIEGLQPNHFPSEAPHLEDLDALVRLTISYMGTRALPEMRRHVVSGRLADLRVLRLRRVALAPDAFLQLPPALRELHLVACNSSVVPFALPALNTLLVTEGGPVGVTVQMGGMPLLASLTVRAPWGPVRLAGPVPRGLTVLEIQWGGAGEPPAPLVWPERCPLVGLVLKHGTIGSRTATSDDNASALRLAEWVFGCHGLTTLHAQAPLGSAGSVLSPLPALRSLALRRCSLRTLPELMLAPSRGLEELDLSHNELGELPPQLLGGLTALRKLNLSHNNLSANAALVANTAPSLESLDMSYNPLGNLCGFGAGSEDVVPDGLSRLHKLRSLRLLDLSHSHVNKICRDWRHGMEHLVSLHLGYTDIAYLTYSDMQYTRAEPSFVHLEGIPLDNLEYTREDYVASAAVRGAPDVEVVLNTSFACDCHQYWATLALRDSRSAVRLKGLKCGDLHFELVPPERLVCAAPEACRGLPSGCECLVRPDLEPPHSLISLDCEGAGLEAVPAFERNVTHAWALRLADNRIARLRADDLPPILREIDLRNNSLRRVDTAAATALAGGHARLRLGGNALECDCDAHDALAALQRLGERADLAEATCGGEPMRVPPPCPTWEWVAGALALAVAALAAVAFAAALARPAMRTRLKAALARFGLLPPPEADPRLRFDAFVSYAHQDEATAAELAARLEGGRAPLRLCLHERDWAPGGWIPAQIAASVRSSRCTVALVSRHYVHSGWARAEFREAHAAALCGAHTLIAVALEPPAALPLDDELRDYLARNTYVRWGDPWFWDKLRVALRSGAPPAPKPGADPA